MQVVRHDYEGVQPDVWTDEDRTPPFRFHHPTEIVEPCFPVNHIPEAIEITDPIAGRSACHLAPAEWRLLGWLEREGYSYDFYSEHQLHAGTLDLDAYRVLIISVTPSTGRARCMNASRTGSTSATGA